MNKFKFLNTFKSKFILISFISLVAICFAITIIFTNFYKSYSTTQTELTGLIQFKKILKLSKDMQQYRDLSLNKIIHDNIKNNSTNIEIKELENNITSDLNDFVQSKFGSDFLQESIKNIQIDWVHIIEINKSNSNEVNFNLYSRIFDNCINFFKDLTVEYKLYIDNNSGVQHLIELISVSIPLVLEKTNELQALGNQILLQKKITAEQAEKVHVLKGIISFLIINMVEDFSDTIRSNPELQSQLLLIQSDISKLNDFISNDVVPNLIINKKIMNSEFFNEKMNLTMSNTYFQIFSNYLPMIEQILYERKIKTIYASIAGIGIPGLLFLFMVFFSLQTYNLILRRVRSLTEATLEFVIGNFKHRIDIKAKDEVSIISLSFNEMASAFEKLFNTHLKNENKLQAIFAASLDPIILINSNGIIIDWSLKAELLFNYYKNEVIGKKLSELIIPFEFQPAFRNGIERYIKSPERSHILNKRIELMGSNKNGILFPMEICITPLSSIEKDNENEYAIEYSVFIRDLTDYNKAIQDLQMSELRFRSIYEQSGDGILTLEPNGKFLNGNPKAIVLFGCNTEAQLQSLTPGIISPKFQPDGQNSIFKAQYFMNKALETGSQTFEWLHQKINGNLFFAEVNLRKVKLLNQVVLQVALRDISAQKALEQSMEKARIETEKLAQLKIDFVSNMSHEIRTPLSTIIGLSRINLKSSDTTKIIENNKHINVAGEHLLGVVNDILDFSKIEAGKMALDFHDFNLKNTLEEIIQLVSIKAEEKSISLNLNFSQKVQQYVNSDSLRLSQIILNLLSNAIKFTTNGSVTLKVEAENDLTIFQVIDTGIGLKQEQVSKLFSAFEQADNSTSRKYGGTGLGLAISLNIAKLLKGTIEVQSVYGVGSVFTLKIPLAPAKTPSDVEEDIQIKSVQGRLKNLRILAADDLVMNRIIIEDILINEKAQFDLVEDGEQVLEKLREKGSEYYDIILMDIQMPNLDGYETTEIALTLAKDIPIIGLTAHAMEDQKIQCIEAGMKDRITKPIQPDELVRIILKYTKKTDEKKQLIETIENEKTQFTNNEKQNTAAVILGTNPNATVINNEIGIETENNNIVVSDTNLSTHYIDWEAFYKRYNNRLSIIQKIINNLLNGSQIDNIKNLEMAIENKDITEIKRIIHNVKSIVGSIDAIDMTNLCLEIETLIKMKNESCTEEILNLTKKLIQMYQFILKELQTHNLK